MEQEFVKLTSSAYRLLEFFPESDPLKNRAKEKVLEIMENLILISKSGDWISFKDYFSENREKLKLKLLQDIDIVLGYIEIGKLQGWLSGINCLIVSEQYKKIKKGICLRIEVVKEATMEMEWPEKSPKQPEAAGASTNGLEAVEEKVAENIVKDISERQEKILDFLDKNGKAQVVDLQTVLANVTKRTIRRDLDELLKMGRIQRLGEFNKVFYKLV